MLVEIWLPWRISETVTTLRNKSFMQPVSKDKFLRIKLLQATDKKKHTSDVTIEKDKK